MAGLPGRASGAASDTDGRWLGVGLEAGEIAGLLMEMVVPKFSDGGAVFVLERGHGGNSRQVVTRRLASRFVQRDGHPVETVLPSGEVFAFQLDSPYGACLSQGTPQVFSGPDKVTLKRIRPAGRELLSHHPWFLAVPLTAGGEVTGVVVTSRGDARGPFSDADIAVIADLARRAGTGIAHAAEFARHRQDSRVLQQGLVPAPPPVPDLVEVAWRSTPAPGEVVGGDWWDIVTLPGMRTGLVVGDVMGHGPAAAMLLAQLRAAAHTLADLDLDPAEMMQRLDRSASALTDGTCATCVYAVVDPANGSCTMSLAGHLAPVLALPDGRTYLPALPAGMPVGVGTGLFGQVRIKLPPGAVLALYTDGLVESRTRSFEDGILALRAAISGEHGDLAGTCDTLVESLRHDDDVTVMLARIPR
jgi:Stage II sporulation protein E (SpoIIE)/GAF domain